VEGLGGGGARGLVRTASMNIWIRRLRVRCDGARENGNVNGEGVDWGRARVDVNVVVEGEGMESGVDLSGGVATGAPSLRTVG
jgi:hypothetical protein